MSIPDTPARLELRGLTQGIAGKRVCRDLTLRMEGGQCWGVLGVNGVGKTTLLHTLAGLKPAQSGEILINGKPRSEYSPRELARACGILFQDHLDTFPCTVLEAALIGRHPYLRSWQWESAQDQDIARHALKHVGLGGLESRDITTLSGGERRRLAIATLLTQSPHILLLDEPANHLDLHYQISLLTQLRQDCQKENRLMVMVLHDVNLAARFCDHVLLLFGDGEQRAGDCADLLTAEVLSELYRHPMTLHRSASGHFFLPE